MVNNRYNLLYKVSGLQVIKWGVWGRVRTSLGSFVSSLKEDKIIFGGRLGMYQYFDMWQVIDEALKLVKSIE